jgi:hypothetical protein
MIVPVLTTMFMHLAKHHFGTELLCKANALTGPNIPFYTFRKIKFHPSKVKFWENKS